MDETARIVSIGRSVPPWRWAQRDIWRLSARHFEGYRHRRIEQLFLQSDIEWRHLSFDAESFDPHESADALHARYAEWSQWMGKAAIADCLTRAEVAACEVDALFTVSCTGYLCPGLSALLAPQLGFRRDIQRCDVVGMGCSGALPGLQRAHDFVKANPGRRALLLTVEVCTACHYVDDTLETVVGNVICADGAAAVLVGGGTGPRIERFHSHTDPAFLDSVGFQSRAGKLRIVLSKDLRTAAGGLVQTTVEGLLEAASVDKDQIDHWIIHSGGRKVIDGIVQCLEIDENAVRFSREVLRDFGNMSSPTVLFVLDATLRGSQPRPGDRGILIAMGPGLSVEAALLAW
jgi:3,5-dihydroxyphenylacetyl-CoA synthase